MWPNYLLTYLNYIYVNEAAGKGNLNNKHCQKCSLHTQNAIIASAAGILLFLYTRKVKSDN